MSRKNRNRCLQNAIAVCSIQTLEKRQMLSSYFVNTSSDLALVNSANLEPGDEVLLKGGVQFNGTLTLGAEDSGTAANPVLITSYDPATGLPIAPDAPASARATLYSGNSNAFLGMNAQGIDLVGLNVLGSGRTVNTASGISFSTNLSGNVKLDHITVDHVDVSGFHNWGLTIGGTVAKSGFSNVRITNVVAHDNGQGGIESHGLFNAKSTLYANANVYVGYCTVYNNTGIAGFSTNSGNGIVLSDLDGGVIEHSVAYNNGALNTHVGGPIGIWGWDLNNLTIQFNESYANHTNSSADGGGFDLDGGVTNSVMQYNYSHDNDGPGFGIYQFSGARAMHDNVVRYNISSNDARKNGAGIDAWNGGSGILRTEIYNNTVSISKPTTGTPQAVYVASATSGMHFRNNIFAVSGGLSLVKVASGKKQVDLRFEGNDYYTNGGAFAIQWDTKTYASLPAFRSGMGQEMLNGSAVGLNVDPQFVNPAGGSAAAFCLQPTSPLKDAGLNLQTRFGINPGPQDYYGDSLPQGIAYDIGADEIVQLLV